MKRKLRPNGPTSSSKTGAQPGAAGPAANPNEAGLAPTATAENKARSDTTWLTEMIRDLQKLAPSVESGKLSVGITVDAVPVPATNRGPAVKATVAPLIRTLEWLKSLAESGNLSVGMTVYLGPRKALSRQSDEVAEASEALIFAADKLRRSRAKLTAEQKEGICLLLQDVERAMGDSNTQPADSGL